MEQDSLKKISEKIEKDSTEFSRIIQEQSDKIKSLELKQKNASKVYEDPVAYADHFGEGTREKESLYKYKRWIDSCPYDSEYREKYIKGIMNPTKMNEARNFLADLHNDTSVSPQASVTKANILNSNSDQLGSVNKASILNTVIGQSAGYLLAPASLEMEIQKLVYESSPMRQIATVKQLKTSLAEIVVENKLAQSQWGSTEVPQPRTESQEYSQVKIGVDSLNATASFTYDLMEDSYYDVEKELKESIAHSMMLAENKAFIDGDGTDRPYGLMHYALNSEAESDRDKEEFLKPVKVTDTVANFNDLDAGPIDKLIDMQGAIFAEYRKNAYYLMNRQTMTNLKKAKTADNLYLLSQGGMWGSPQELGKGMNMMIAGYPVMEMQDLPNVGSNNYPIFFGSFKKYFIYDRIGMMTIVDNVTQKGSVVVYCRKRLGAGAVNMEGVACLQTT